MHKNITLLTEAYKFSALKHTSQRRKGIMDIPYINHPVEVANILSHTCNSDDFELLAGAILHDTLEDTDTTFEELESVFGASIAKLVLEVTDDMSLPKPVRRQAQIDKAASLTDNAKRIKIADKTCNILDILQTRFHWTNKQKKEYISWSVKVADNCKGVEPALENEFKKALQLAKETIGWIDSREWK